MVITNNASAGFILGTFNRNLNKKSKAAGQLALGEKIRNAGDDASSYAISEKMRVRIRALNQADSNVQNGTSMLRVAEGAIQSQINILRKVKEKVIDAHNDTNTDDDRAIIQKEITQYYNEINDIAAETTFNGKHLLLGTEVSEAVKSWYRLDHAEKLDGSDKFSFVSGTEEYLDDYSVSTVSGPNAMSGGTPDTHNVIEITIGKYTSENTINNTSFQIIYPGGQQTFVFTRNPNLHYKGDNLTVIDIEHVSALSDAIDNLRKQINGLLKVEYDAGNTTDRPNRRIVLSTVAAGDKTSDTNLYDVVGVALEGGDGYYTATSPLPSYMINNKKSGKDGATAAWKWDLSGYNNTTTVETFISQYVGQGLYHSGTSKTYEFVDSSKYPSADSVSKIDGSTVIDLHQLRSAVSSGKTVSEAFANLLTSRMGSPLVAAATNTSGQVTGVNIKATVHGSEGNDQKVSFVKGDLRDYTLDFKSLLGGVSGAGIPGKLDGQGFRVYDATDPNKWFNVLFVNGINPNDDPRPASGGSGLDIDTLVIDVSDVDSVASLVKTLYQGDGDKNMQGLSQFLANSSQSYRVAADYSNGSITIYDTRLNSISPSKARIANGVVDNVVNDYRNTYVNDLVIQHTDKASANIHVRIPQTTLDHVFGYKIGAGSLDDYSVMTSEKREFLLGHDYPTTVKGALDKGLQYLIDANTLIGAQIVHMESAGANIVTENENTMAAESVIRDADIAKSSMDMATANILSQSAMAMLSQFNHSSSDVLGLLQ